MSRMITDYERQLMNAGLCNPLILDRWALAMHRRPRQSNMSLDDALYMARATAGLHNPNIECPPYDPYISGMRLFIPLLKFNEITSNQRIYEFVSSIPFNVFSKERRKTIADIIVDME